MARARKGDIPTGYLRFAGEDAVLVELMDDVTTACLATLHHGDLLRRQATIMRRFPGAQAIDSLYIIVELENNFVTYFEAEDPKTIPANVSRLIQNPVEFYSLRPEITYVELDCDAHQAILFTAAGNRPVQSPHPIVYNRQFRRYIMIHPAGPVVLREASDELLKTTES